MNTNKLTSSHTGPVSGLSFPTRCASFHSLYALACLSAYHVASPFFGDISFFLVISSVRNVSSRSLAGFDGSTTSCDGMIISLWHLHLGHMKFGGLKLLSTKNMAKDMLHIGNADEVCERCIHGKHYRPRSSKKIIWRASRPLSFVHTDICGHLKPISTTGNQYFLTLIDDYSRNSWVYF